MLITLKGDAALPGAVLHRAAPGVRARVPDPAVEALDAGARTGASRARRRPAAWSRGRVPKQPPATLQEQQLPSQARIFATKTPLVLAAGAQESFGAGPGDALVDDGPVLRARVALFDTDAAGLELGDPERVALAVS